MSRGIDFNALQPEDDDQKPVTVRHLVMGSFDDLKALTDDAKKRYPFFGVLLPHAQAGKLNEYVQTYWQRLHTMSGSACLITTNLPPEQPDEEMRRFLVKLLGEQEAAKSWERYHVDPKQVQDTTYELAQSANVDYNRLPCLALMSDLDARQKIVLRLPNWDANDLTSFFEELFTRVNHHRQEPDPAKRFADLKADLGVGFATRLQAARAARGIRETLAQVEWSEVIKSTLTNQEFLTTAFKLALGAFGVQLA